jgi:hypothetical protein
MSSVLAKKNLGDLRTEALLRVKNLPTWQTKIDLAFMAFHDLGT